MTAWQALTDFFKRYTRFIGTRSRSAFNWIVWFWGVIYLIVAVLIIVVAGLGVFFGKHGDTATDTTPFLGTIILVALSVMVLSIIVIIPNLALYARRLHDMGFSGWWQIVPMIVNAIITLIIIFFTNNNEQFYWLQSMISLVFALWLSFSKSKPNSPYS